jgi:hypothetical protein
MKLSEKGYVESEKQRVIVSMKVRYGVFMFT